MFYAWGVTFLVSGTARRAFATIVAVVVILTACGGEDAAVAANERAATAPESEPIVDTASPLESELGFASDPSRRQFQLITRQRQADESITQCMQEAGFFYATVPTQVTLRSGAFVGDGSREWTQQFGLGITSSFREALTTDTSVDATDAETQNRDYVNSLDDAQAAAYDRALVGDLSAPSGADGYTPAGCWGSSFGEIVEVLGLIDQFEADLMVLNSRLLADPRMRDFQLRWSECMDGAGHQYGTEVEMVDDVYARLLDIEVIEVAGLAQVADVDALNALGEFEVAVGLASFDCRQTFAAAQEELRHGYEREFLDDNRFQIADLLRSAVPGD